LVEVKGRKVVIVADGSLPQALTSKTVISPAVTCAKFFANDLLSPNTTANLGLFYLMFMTPGMENATKSRCEQG
jgi:hypothetical protein